MADNAEFVLTALEASEPIINYRKISDHAAALYAKGKGMPWKKARMQALREAGIVDELAIAAAIKVISRDHGFRSSHSQKADQRKSLMHELAGHLF